MKQQNHESSALSAYRPFALKGLHTLRTPRSKASSVLSEQKRRLQQKYEGSTMSTNPSFQLKSRIRTPKGKIFGARNKPRRSGRIKLRDDSGIKNNNTDERDEVDISDDSDEEREDDGDYEVFNPQIGEEEREESDACQFLTLDDEGSSLLVPDEDKYDDRQLGNDEAEVSSLRKSDSKRGLFKNKQITSFIPGTSSYQRSKYDSIGVNNDSSTFTDVTLDSTPADETLLLGTDEDEIPSKPVDGADDADDARYVPSIPTNDSGNSDFSANDLSGISSITETAAFYPSPPGLTDLSTAATAAAAAACIVDWNDRGSLRTATEVVSSIINREGIRKNSDSSSKRSGVDGDGNGMSYNKSDVFFWAKCSIVAASVVARDTVKTESALKMAQIAAETVLRNCSHNGNIARPTEDKLADVATKTSLALLKYGGMKSSSLASATSVAILNEGTSLLDQNYPNQQTSNDKKKDGKTNIKSKSLGSKNNNASAEKVWETNNMKLMEDSQRTIVEHLNRYTSKFENIAYDAKDESTSWDTWDTPFENKNLKNTKPVLSATNGHHTMRDLGSLLKEREGKDPVSILRKNNITVRDKGKQPSNDQVSGGSKKETHAKTKAVKGQQKKGHESLCACGEFGQDEHSASTRSKNAELEHIRMAGSLIKTLSESSSMSEGETNGHSIAPIGEMRIGESAEHSDKENTTGAWAFLSDAQPRRIETPQSSPDVSIKSEIGEVILKDRKSPKPMTKLLPPRIDTPKSTRSAPGKVNTTRRLNEDAFEGRDSPNGFGKDFFGNQSARGSSNGKLKSDKATERGQEPLLPSAFCSVSPKSPTRGSSPFAFQSVSPVGGFSLSPKSAFTARASSPTGLRSASPKGMTRASSSGLLGAMRRGRDERSNTGDFFGDVFAKNAKEDRGSSKQSTRKGAAPRDESGFDSGFYPISSRKNSAGKC